MRTYLYSLLFAFVYVFPIASARVLYEDDIRRSVVNGAQNWLGEGRQLMAGIHYLLNFGTEVFNLSPLTQFLGLAALCFAGCLFVRKYATGFPMYLRVLCVVSLFVSPFFLENLAFGFESVGFCLSLALALLSCCVPDDAPAHWAVIAPLVCTFLLLCIYQASLGAVFIAVLLALYMRPERYGLFLSRVGGVLLGTCAYMLSVARTVVQEGHAGEHSAYGFSLDLFTANLSAYLGEYGRLFFSDRNVAVFVLFIAVVAACVISAMLRGKRWTVVLWAVSVVMSVLPLCVLENAVVSPRVFLSFNLVFFFSVMMLSELCLRHPRVVCLPVLVMLWAFGMSALFGNLLVAQDRYERYVVSCIAHDLGKLQIPRDAEFYYNGNPIVCLEAVKAGKKYKLFNDLNNTMFRTDRVFWKSILSHYLHRVLPKKVVVPEKKEYPILVSHDLYFIAGDGKHVLIYIR